MSSRRRILVFLGGPSSEHEVSLVSGSGVVSQLPAKHYEVIPVIIGRDGLWKWSPKALSWEERKSFHATESDFSAYESALRPSLDSLPESDCVFLALHGSFGEDGQVQSLLRYWKRVHTGSGVLGSALAMDKIKSKEIYAAHGIDTPPWGVLYREKDLEEQLQEQVKNFGLPLVLKNPVGGSSLGMGMASTPAEAVALAEKLFADTAEVLVETFVGGREGTCAFLDGAGVLPPTEIVLRDGQTFFDFEAKYRGKSEEVTPGDFGPELTEKMQVLAARCHRILGLSVYSRTDFLLQEGKILVLETNTLPGLTPQSLLPQAAACIGLDYPALLHHIVCRSLESFS